MSLSRSIEICCAKAGINQQELADRIEVASSHISRIKSSNECTQRVLKKLAGAFNMKPSEFMAEGGQ